jgi:hypothetical protein
MVAQCRLLAASELVKFSAKRATAEHWDNGAEHGSALHRNNSKGHGAGAESESLTGRLRVPYSKLLVMRSTSAIEVNPSRTFARPSSRSRRIPSLEPPRPCHPRRRARGSAHGWALTRSSPHTTPDCHGSPSPNSANSQPPHATTRKP